MNLYNLAVAAKLGKGSGGASVEPLSVTENGIYTAPVGTAYSPVTVDVPTGGGGGGIPKLSGVNFIDYDGSLVQHYTAEEFASLSAMPANPSHDGLTAQGWNWSLVNAKAYVAKYGILYIGQMYITESGKTEIDIALAEGGLAISVALQLDGSVDIDWGDGSAHDTITATSLVNVATSPDHVYSSPGNYTVKLDVNGTAGLPGDSSWGCRLISPPSSESFSNIRYYSACIRAIRIGAGITSIGLYGFRYCRTLRSVTIPYNVSLIERNAFTDMSSLKSITIPNSVSQIRQELCSSCSGLSSIAMPDSVTNVTSKLFSSCYGLSSVAIPDGVTRLESYCFSSCYGLSSVVIPDSVTSLGNYAFDGCYALPSVVIPDGVTSLGYSVFRTCYSLKQIHFLPAVPPTIDDTAFTNISTFCVFYVPAESLEAYKTASYWSAYASRMVGE